MDLRLRIRRSALVLPVTALAITGCPVEADPPDGSSHPCAPLWGAAPGGGRVVVDAAAPAGGDGSEESPFSSVIDAITAVRASRVRQIVIAPGDYPGRYLLSQDIPEWADSGLQLLGCGREETHLVAVTEQEWTDSGYVDRLRPVLDIVGSGTRDVLVRDLALVGGRRGGIVRDGAGALGPVVLQHVDVVDSVRLGLLIDGASTVAELRDVHVDGVATEGGAFGWGIAVQSRMPLSGQFTGPTVIEDVVVEGASGLGILVDGGWVQLLDSEVVGVEPLDGKFGRGVQVQNWSMGTLQGLDASGNSDAALFLESPGRNGDALEVLNCSLGPTSAAPIEELPEESAGDGLVATQFWTAAPYPSDTFVVVVDGVDFEGNPRAHMLAEGVTAEVGTNNVFGKGTSFPLVSQGGAAVQGVGGGAPGMTPEVLTGDAALGLFRQPMVLDGTALEE